MLFYRNLLLSKISVAVLMLFLVALSEEQPKFLINQRSYKPFIFGSYFLNAVIIKLSMLTSGMLLSFIFL